jgi:hypothetical protein
VNSSRCFLSLALLLFAFEFCQAEDASKRSAKKPTGAPNSTLSNINRISAWYTNNGEMERDPATGNAGLTFPRGTSTAIYSAGLIWGGNVNDGVTPILRVNGSSYINGTGPGAILGTRTGSIENPTDPNVRIWRIRRDFATADLRQDAAEMLHKTAENVTDADMTALRDQYRKDWNEWPASKGAPFYDRDGNGIYSPQWIDQGGVLVPDPAADEPGLANADQVIWFVANDIVTGVSPWQSPPIGMELQTTIWAYARDGFLGNTIFKKSKLIYKGTSNTPPTASITDMYICHWSDPDVGDSGDDFVGCDTTLSLGYAYNAVEPDKEYAKFNLPPPAIGYDFFQGPIVASAGSSAIFDLKVRQGYKNLPMTSFICFVSGGTYADPPFTPFGAIQWYNMLQGFPPTSTNPLFSEFYDPQGNPTKFLFPGDPVRHTGWLDGLMDPPGDRRMLQSSGPFNMALGDTQEIVTAVIAGIGNDRLNSITEMRTADRYAQLLYDDLFSFIPPSFAASTTFPNSSTAHIAVQARGTTSAYKTIATSLLRSDGSKAADLILYDDGTHNDGLANDGVWGNAIDLPTEQRPLTLKADITDNGSSVHTLTGAVENVTVAGDVHVVAPVVRFDNINNDGIVNPGEYVEYGLNISNGTNFALNISAAAESYLPVGIISSKTSKDSPGSFTLMLPPNYTLPSFTVKLDLVDTLGNRWRDSCVFAVVKTESVTDTVRNVASDVVGHNDAMVDVVVYNPMLAGKAYDIWYGGTVAAPSWTLVEKKPVPEYAEVSATLDPLKSTTLATGTGLFSLNDAKDRISATISIQGVSGSNPAAALFRGTLKVKSLPLTGGLWTKTDASEPLTDSLVTDFVAGNLQLRISTDQYPLGETAGMVTDGLNKRKSLPTAAAQNFPPLTFEENRFVGFSVYLTPNQLGYAVQQSAPTKCPIIGIPNSEQTYMILGPTGALAGNILSDRKVSIKFTTNENWALGIYPSPNDTPSKSKFIRVPFASYKDTVRVWPVVLLRNPVDSLWSCDSNQTASGKPVFDKIAGINDTLDATGKSISYYGYVSTVPFPPTSVAKKSPLVSGASFIAKDFYFVNFKSDGIPPQAGTVIEMTPFARIKPGDIKRIVLRTNGVEQTTDGIIPVSYALLQNYPNPFNPATTIEFSLPIQANVSLKVFDIIGREVAELIHGQMRAGTFRFRWDGRNSVGSSVASGVYFYRLAAGSFIETKKMLLLR